MSDSIPTPVKRTLNLFSESMFALALVMVVLLVTIGSFSRVNRLSNVAQFLPEDTQAFVVVNMHEYIQEPDPLLTHFYNQDLLSLEWFKRDIALAWVDGEMIRFVETRSRSQAQTFMKSLLVEDEVMIESDDFHCYSVTQPDCFTFEGNFLVTGSSNALAHLSSGLEGQMSFQNVRSRLPYNSDLFAYVNLQATRQAFLTSMGELSIWEPGYLESVLHIFPAYGTSIKMEDAEWKAESYVAVDKSALGGESFFHASKRFNAEMLPLLPEGFSFEWSGVELSSLLRALGMHLEELNPAAALVVEEKGKQLWTEYFGEADWAEFSPLFQGEQAFAWNPGEAYVWVSTLDEENYDQALLLKDYFIANYEHSEVTTMSSGEQKAELRRLSATREDYQGDDYFRVGPEGESTHFIGILDEVILVSNSEEAFFETLDRYRDRLEQRDLSESLPMIFGTDHTLSLDMTTLPESHIINLLLPGVDSWMSSLKLFDDGIYIRSHLSY